MILNYFQNPTVLVIAAIVMVMALIFHNIFQSWVASRLGDNSPRFAGFMRFDPQQQLEPFGVLFLFLLGFGWPRQVPINGRNYRGKGRSEALAWYAGPLAYLIVALLSLIAASIFDNFRQTELVQAFFVAARFAILHAVINLFPIFPLDGARAARAWGNREVRNLVDQTARFGLWGFILFFLVLSFTGILAAIERFFAGILLQIVGLIPGL